MSEMTYKCPFCGGEFLVESEWCGMSVECPHCQRSVKIGTPLPPDAEEQSEEEGGEDDFEVPVFDDILIGVYQVLSVVCFIIAILDFLTPHFGLDLTGAYTGPAFFSMIGYAFGALGRMLPTFTFGNVDDEE